MIIINALNLKIKFDQVSSKIDAIIYKEKQSSQKIH